MSFFSKIAKMINGNTSQPDASSPNDNEDKRHDNIVKTGVSNNRVDRHLNQRDEADSDEHTFDKRTTTEYNNVSFFIENDFRTSESLSEQRYGWHLFLLSILSSIKDSKPDTLKYLTIYILKSKNDYKWNDEAFKSELRQALDKQGLAYIGSSAIVIDVVSEKTFKQLSEKTITDNQFKKKINDVILFGSKKETTEQKFATAIDKRAFVINELLKKFRSSTGTDTKLMESLTIVVIRNEEDDDMAKYDWIGKKFEDDLKRELANAFLDKIGSKSLQIVLKPRSEIEGCLSLIDNQVYYKWGKADSAQEESSKEIPYERVVAHISIIEGTGSLVKSIYTLDSDIKKLYHIGRGVASRKGGKYRVNDIVIKDREADEELAKYNVYVSSAHADIVFKNNTFFLKAAIGGCRALDGSPTKIVRNEKATELRDTNLLYPLEDGDMIELGKSVLLAFSLTDGNVLETTFEKPKSNNAMSIDDSF